MNIIRLVCAVPVLLFISTTTAPAAAVEARVEAGYGGVCKIGCWNPVTVDLANPEHDIDGAAVVSVRRGAQTVRYMTPVKLTQSSHKEYTIYVPLNQFSAELKVQVLDGRSVIHDVSARYRDVYSEDYLLVTAGKEDSALNFLSGLTVDTSTVGRPPAPSSGGGRSGGSIASQIQVGHLSPISIPDKPLGFDGVDMLVLTDLDASRLEPQTLDALRMWIASGGSVTVCGGADYARLKLPFFNRILPVEIQGAIESAGLDVLGAKYGFQLPAGNVFVCKSSPKPGTAVLTAQDGLPLIAQGRYGLGTVTFLAFDPLSFPLKGWDGQPNMWKDLILSARASDRVNRPEADGQTAVRGMRRWGGPRTGYGLPPSSMEQTALSMKSTAPPSIALVGLFLVSYVLALVPLNYFYLRKKNRYEMAWITTPAIILLFTLGAYVTGYAMRGSRTIMNRIALLEGASNTDAASVTGYLGVYAPGRGRYDMSVDDPFILACEGGSGSSESYDPQPADVVEGETVTLKNVDMRQWSGRTFRVEGGAKLRGRLESDLVLNGSRLTGKIVNHTGFDLRKCVICFGDARQNIGPLHEGDTVRVSIEGKSPGSAGTPTIPVAYSGGVDTGVRTEIAGKITGRLASCADPVLVGWMDSSRLPVRLERRGYSGEDMGLAMFHLRYRLGASVVVPSGFAEGIIVEQPPGVQSHVENGRPVIDYITDNYVVEDFRLWQSSVGGFAPTWLQVRTQCAGYAPSVYCYNWKTGGWDSLPSGSEVTVPDPSAHVRSADGLVRLKLQVKGSCSGVNLSVAAEGGTR